MADPSFFDVIRRGQFGPEPRPLLATLGTPFPSQPAQAPTVARQGVESPYYASAQQSPSMRAPAAPPPMQPPAAQPTLGSPPPGQPPALGGQPAPRSFADQYRFSTEMIPGLQQVGKDAFGQRSFTAPPGTPDPRGVGQPNPAQNNPYYGITDANTIRAMVKRGMDLRDRRYQNALGFESQGPMVDYVPPMDPVAKRFLDAAMTTNSAVTGTNMVDAYFKQIAANRAPLEFEAGQQQARLGLASQAEQARMQREAGLAQANLQGQYGLQQAALTGRYGLQQAEITRGLMAAAEQMKGQREAKMEEFKLLSGTPGPTVAASLVPGYAEADPKRQKILLQNYIRGLQSYLGGGQQGDVPQLMRQLPTEGTYTQGMGYY